MDLNNIKDPSFLKELDIRQLNQLSSDIREVFNYEYFKNWWTSF